MSPSLENETEIENQINKNRIPRRDFLRAGLILPLSLMPLAETLAVPAASAQAPLSPFVVGYQASEGASVVDASQIKQGDALFQQTGARVRIAGFNPDGQLESKPTGAQIVSIRSFLHFYPAVSGQPVIWVPAWSSEIQALPMSGTINNLAAPVCMTMPLCPDGSLAFSIAVCRANSVVTTRVIRLTTRRGQEAKLRRGTYFVAAGKTAFTAAEWNAVLGQNVLMENATTLGETDNSDVEIRNAPDFPYLVVRVDHAANTLS